MSGWQERIPSDGRLVRAVRNAQLNQHNAKLLARIALESGGNVQVERERKVLSRLGDERQLRGIPAIGRGVAGAVPGSVPGGNLRSDRTTR